MLTQDTYEYLQWMFHSKYINNPLSTWKRFLEENGIESKISVPISSVEQFVEKTLEYIFIPKEFAERAIIMGFLP